MERGSVMAPGRAIALGQTRVGYIMLKIVNTGIKSQHNGPGPRRQTLQMAKTQIIFVKFYFLFKNEKQKTKDLHFFFAIISRQNSQPTMFFKKTSVKTLKRKKNFGSHHRSCQVGKKLQVTIGVVVVAVVIVVVVGFTFRLGGIRGHRRRNRLVVKQIRR